MVRRSGCYDQIKVVNDTTIIWSAMELYYQTSEHTMD